ncbi:hypothetical protein JCM8547_007727 [Rhodosporidiobolus lusitaniae]
MSDSDVIWRYLEDKSVDIALLLESLEEGSPAKYSPGPATDLLCQVRLALVNGSVKLAGVEQRYQPFGTISSSHVSIPPDKVTIDILEPLAVVSCFALGLLQAFFLNTKKGMPFPIDELWYIALHHHAVVHSAIRYRHFELAHDDALEKKERAKTVPEFIHASGVRLAEVFGLCRRTSRHESEPQAVLVAVNNLLYGSGFRVRG